MKRIFLSILTLTTFLLINRINASAKTEEIKETAALAEIDNYVNDEIQSIEEDSKELAKSLKEAARLESIYKGVGYNDADFKKIKDNAMNANAFVKLEETGRGVSPIGTYEDLYNKLNEMAETDKKAILEPKAEELWKKLTPQARSFIDAKYYENLLKASPLKKK